MNKMPVLFVGHGSPMNALDAENPFNQGFRRIAQKFAKPKAILMISAHWYGNRLQVTSGERPEMIYDFYGFPAALSQVQYPAPGSPELAGQVRSLLQPENVEMNPERGFDHGAWAVLKHLYPEADIPVVQLSLNLMQPAQWHFDLAKKLAPLREQGVLVVGSGNIVHNLRAMRRDPAAGYEWAKWTSAMPSTAPLPRRTTTRWCITNGWGKPLRSPCRRPNTTCRCSTPPRCANRGTIWKYLMTNLPSAQSA